MPESRALPARIHRTWRNLRTKGAWPVARTLLARVGVRLTPFYWVRETLPAEIPAQLRTFPEGFTWRELGHEEIAALEPLHDAEEGVDQLQLLRDAVAKGNHCLGVFRNGEIVAFTAFSTTISHSQFHPVPMGPNEAYLCNMYVLPAARGHNIAGILRYQNYEVLRKMGRDTFFSVTVASNTASWRFKEKLNARKVFYGIYVVLGGRWVLRPVLRRY